MCTQKGAFITESVMRLIGGADQSRQGDTEGESGEHLAAGRAYTPCNSLVWQVNNAGLVDHKVSQVVANSCQIDSYRYQSCMWCNEIIAL